MIAHSGRHAVIPDIAMHGIRKVDRTGPFRQLENVTPRGKNINLVREQVDLDVLNKLQRVAGALLHFQQPLHPFSGAGMRHTRARFLGLVKPVGGNPIIRHVFHFMRTNLDLNRDAVHTF